MYSGFVGHGNVFLADFYNFLAPTALTCANKGGTRELFFIVSASTQAGLFFHGIDSQWTRPQIHNSGQTLRPFPPSSYLD